ncbi:MAG: hypothetical protein ABSH12_09495 [Endomicrobiales bacterium]|jgi:hypothetical protein
MKQLIGFLIILSFSLPAFAAFDDTGWGARPLGMGGAFTAVADDANGPLFNPAGSAQTTQKEATFMSAQLFTGLEGVQIAQNYFGYVQPLGGKMGSVSIAYASLSAPGYYLENTGCISYGKFFDSLSSENIKVSLGASAVYLSHQYTLDQYTMHDPVFANGNTGSALTADVGALVVLPKTGISLAYVSKYINNPNVGLLTEDIVSNENVAAVAYYTDMLPFLHLPRFTIDTDVVNQNDTPTDVRIGAETWLMDGKFAVRMGENASEVSMGFGYVLGFKNSGTSLVIDYSFGWPLQIEETTGSHRIAVTVRFP